MYNIWPTAIAVDTNKRAREEQNYIAQRRTVEDAREDETAKLSDAARAERIQTYGAQGYDTVNLGQTEGIQQRRELHPGAVEQQGATLESTRADTKQTGVQTAGMEADNVAEAGKREREAAVRMLDAIEASGATSVQEIAQRIPPAMAAQLGTDPAKLPQLFEVLGQAPDLPTALKAMRDGLMGQETVTGTVTGIGPDGKPMFFNTGSRDKPGAVSGVAPDDRMFALNREGKALSNDYIRAQTGYMNERSRGGAAGADKQTPEQIAAAADALQGTINDMRTQLNAAVQSGAITSTGPDSDIVTNLFSGDNPVGRFIGGLTGDPKEGQRKTIDDTATMLLTSLINSPGMSSRLFDSNAEKDTWTAMLGKSGSYEARMEAINKFERFAQARLADPARIGRPPLGAAPTPGADAAPAAPAAPTVSPARRAELDAMYGRD